jgi:hypothetical protein
MFLWGRTFSYLCIFLPKKTPKKVHKTLPAGGAPVVRHKTVESSDSNVLVGLGIGASAVFLLLRTVV